MRRLGQVFQPPNAERMLVCVCACGVHALEKVLPLPSGFWQERVSPEVAMIGSTLIREAGTNLPGPLTAARYFYRALVSFTWYFVLAHVVPLFFFLSVTRAAIPVRPYRYDVIFTCKQYIKNATATIKDLQKGYRL